MDNQLISEIVKLFPQNFELQKITQYKFSSQQNQFQKICSLTSMSRISINNFLLFQEIEQKLRQFNLPNNIFTQLIESIFPKYTTNEKVYGFSNLHLYQDGVFSKNQKFDTLLDFINIIIFWTSDNYDSLQTFKDLHTKLNGEALDIKVFGINIDSTYESWEKCMLELQTYESYHLSKSNKNYNLLMKALLITSLPYCLIINKNQSIVLNGTFNFKELYIEFQNLCIIKYTQNLSANGSEKIKPEYNSVSQENFKNLKNLMKQDIQEMISAIFSDEDQINLQLVKKTKFIGKNSKVVYYRSLLFIDNQISENSKESYEAFQQYLGEVIPQRQFLNFKTTKILKISEELQNIRNFVQEILQLFNLESILYKSESLNYKWDFEKNSFICDHQIKDEYKLNKKIDLKQFDKIYKQIQEVVSDFDQQFKDKVSNHFNQLIQPIGLGDNFEKIDGFQNRLGEETIIGHKPGQMLAIVWLIPCPFIIIKLEQNRQKLKETFGDKLNIVFLAIEKVDEDIQIIYQNQPEVNFFYPIIDPYLVRQKYNIKYFPFLTIVDHLGIVRHADFYQNFNYHIQNIYWISTYANSRIGCDWEDMNDYLRYQELITKSLGNCNKFQYNITVKQNQNQEFIVMNDYMTRQINLHYCHQMIYNLDNYVQRQKNTIVQKVIKSFTIPFPAVNCDICNKSIGKENPYYFNFFKIQNICCECAEEKKHGRYIIQDVLAFINAPISDMEKLKHIDVFRFGKNIQPVGIGNQVHKATCDSCAKTIIGDRYILINGEQGQQISGYQDYCYKCFHLIKNRSYKGDDNFKNINENSIFLRVIYAIGYRFY